MKWKKVTIGCDEYYPYWYIDLAKDTDKYIFEISDELFDKYTNIIKEFDEIMDEIESVHNGNR